MKKVSVDCIYYRFYFNNWFLSQQFPFLLNAIRNENLFAKNRLSAVPIQPQIPNHRFNALRKTAVMKK